MEAADRTVQVQGAMIVVERERMGRTAHALRDDVRNVAVDGGQVLLRAGRDREDDRTQDLLVLIVPGDVVAAVDGSIVLSLTPAGGAPTAVRHIAARRSADGHGVRIDVEADGVLTGRWGYSRRPVIRPVALGGPDDPEAALDASVLHVGDVQRQAVRADITSLDDGWFRLGFAFPMVLASRLHELDGCERVLDAVDRRIGEGFLRWPEAAVDRSLLDAAAADVERATGGRFDLTVDVGASEITRGRRLQPAVRHPVTLVRDDGTTVAATFGCSMSDG